MRDIKKKVKQDRKDAGEFYESLPGTMDQFQTGYAEKRYVATRTLLWVGLVALVVLALAFMLFLDLDITRQSGGIDFTPSP